MRVAGQIGLHGNWDLVGITSMGDEVEDVVGCRVLRGRVEGFRVLGVRVKGFGLGV